MAWIPPAMTLAATVVGANEAGKSRDAANAARAEALAQYANISIPEAEQMMLNLQQHQLQGTLDPALEQFLPQGPSAMEGISVDPRLRQQQMAALEQYTQMAQGQMNPADQAAFELARQSAAGEQQARQNAILQEMQQRGQGGAGAELIAKLSANQSGAQMLQQAQLEQAQAMQQARMAALQQQANLSSGIRKQEFGEQSDVARARDVIAAANAQQQASIGSRNVAARNRAQEANLTNRQEIANLNTQLLNTQQIRNKQLPQQTFENQMTLADARAGQYGRQASASQQQAKDTASMWGTLGQGGGTVLSSIFNKSGDTTGSEG